MDIKDKQDMRNGLFQAMKYFGGEVNSSPFLRGIIKNKNTDGTYNVTINLENYTLKALPLGQEFVENDLVFVMIINNNFSEKYIFCKVP